MARSRACLLVTGAFLGVAASAQFLGASDGTYAGFVDVPGRGVLRTGWYYHNDIAVYDGDIIYGSVAAFEALILNVTFASDDPVPYEPEYSPRSGASSYPDGSDDSHDHRLARRSFSVFPNGDFVWPDGNVRYRYTNDSSEVLLEERVDAAIAIWSEAVPCLRWTKEANGAGDGLPGIVTITPGDECTATIGGDQNFELQMTLGPQCNVPVVLHEWGHSLGLLHEQRRPDREQFVTFQCENVISYPPPVPDPASCCLPGQCCDFDLCQFTIDPGSYHGQDGPDAPGAAYDIDSIMHYVSTAFAKSGTETLVGAPKEFPGNLSAGDIARVRHLYGCVATTEPDPKPDPRPECPAPCNPLANRCSATAVTCVYPSLEVLRADSASIPRGACACRAGYKADGVADDDSTKQWRLPADEGNFRVWVAEGVECNTLCEKSTGPESCGEVKELSAACLTV